VAESVNRWDVEVDDGFSIYVANRAPFTSEAEAWRWLNDNRLPGGVKMTVKESKR